MERTVTGTNNVSDEQFKRSISMKIDTFFAKIDEDRSGTITRQELQAGVRASIKGQFSPDKLFEMLDQDKSDEVSREEFKTFFINLCKQQGQSQQKVLSYLDKLVRKFRRNSTNDSIVKLDESQAMQTIIKTAFKRRLAVQMELERRLKEGTEKQDVDIQRNNQEIHKLKTEVRGLVNEIQIMSGQEDDFIALASSSRRQKLAAATPNAPAVTAEGKIEELRQQEVNLIAKLASLRNRNDELENSQKMAEIKEQPAQVHECIGILCQDFNQVKLNFEAESTCHQIYSITELEEQDPRLSMSMGWL